MKLQYSVRAALRCQSVFPYTTSRNASLLRCLFNIVNTIKYWYQAYLFSFPTYCMFVVMEGWEETWEWGYSVYQERFLCPCPRSWILSGALSLKNATMYSLWLSYSFKLEETAVRLFSEDVFPIHHHLKITPKSFWLAWPQLVRLW